MKIITISRQFGSGGRELGKRLADQLGWDYYDREIIQSLAEEQGLDPEYVHKVLSGHGWHQYQLSYRKQEVYTVEIAASYRFLSSPTILVNGQDIFDTITESDCGCCGDIAGVQVDCRVFEHDGKTYEVPTKEMLADAILKTIYHPTACTCGEYQLPENLKRFFAGKEKKAASPCCCGGNSKCC